MKLFHRDFGGEANRPLAILHGLYGSSRNWSSVARKLSSALRPFALDLRNHGASPHAPTMSYPEMAEDVIEWLNDRGLERVALMGHSLGGKVAMAVACRFPERVERLVVVDVAPKHYSPDPTLLEALLKVDLEGVARRSRVEDQIRDAIPDGSTRQFLLTNLVRDGDRFAWLANLPVLKRELSRLGESPVGQGDRYSGPVLFMAGGRSTYVEAGDQGSIHSVFPGASIRFFEESGHNVHIDGGDAFVEAVIEFAGR